MATVFIQKRKREKRNSYLIYFKDPATTRLKYFKTFQRLKEAEQAANDLRFLIDNGKTLEVQKNRAKFRFMIFEEVSARQKSEWQTRLQDGGIKEKTFDDYVYILNALNRTFGKKLLFEISSEDILTYRSDLATNYSNVTSNRHLFIIKQIFKSGQKFNAVLEDFAASIKYLSEKEQERNKFLLPGELDRLIEASRQGRTRFYLPSLILLGAEHGASKQEALSLRWADIDFDYEGSGLIKFFRTKNNRERTEYLMPRTRKALLEWQEHQAWMRHRKKIDAGNSNLVFCRLNGTPVKGFDTAWRRARKNVGLEDFHFHDLRHTFCSNLLLAGSDLKDVKEMIGHSDISMTDRYTHLTLNHKRLQQTKLAGHYAKSK